jgi:hypothetical protein
LGGDGFYESGCDEVAECGFGDADVAADADEADAAFVDESSGEAFAGAQDVGRL